MNDNAKKRARVKVASNQNERNKRHPASKETPSQQRDTQPSRQQQESAAARRHPKRTATASRHPKRSATARTHQPSPPYTHHHALPMPTRQRTVCCKPTAARAVQGMSGVDEPPRTSCAASFRARIAGEAHS